jgi:hypothetical protein
MKHLIVVLIVLGAAFQSLAQKPTKNQNLPPDYLEQLKKSLPPGTQLPDQMVKMLQQMQNPNESSNASIPDPAATVQMPPVQQYALTNEPSGKTDYSPFGSGRTENERRAALIAVENWLNAKPLILPKPESVPAKSYMLQMAGTRNKLARQKFNPEDLSEYTRAVTWVPRFDGKQTEPAKAREYSILVSLATNNKPAPYFNMALASAVFSLDPDRCIAANNLAAAILSGGELICEKNTSPGALITYRRDAESAFLYAIFHSMKNDAWSEETLTPAINLGNLCIDLGKPEEARSLFMVARKIKPQSWEAALGLAAYFLSLKDKQRALAILEDDNLDKPGRYLLPLKGTKSLEKSEPFSELPPESPAEKYEEGINIMIAEPILTSADYVTQLDQSERNKMRYFIENLPVQGSFKAPPLTKLTQYSTLKAISSPQGASALKDFIEMLGVYSLGSFAATANQQMEWLSTLGMKVDPGIDMNDVARHPEKYAGKNMKLKPKISGKETLMANVMAMKRDAEKAKLELATGKTEGLTKLAAKVDPMHGILLLNPDDYADPMNVIMQKMNYTVYNRKNHLYKGYLYSLNKKTYSQVSEIISQSGRKLTDLTKRMENDLKSFEEQEAGAKKQAAASGTPFRSAEWDMRRHQIHVAFYTAANNIEETAFASATNIVAPIYMQKFKPNLEAFYYDVIRHVAMISDPEVRKQKDADLHQSISQALTWYLQTVLLAHGSFKYYQGWECACNESALLDAREQEKKEMAEEENARIQRNKDAKAKFESGEIPESSPLFKKLDAYVDEYNFILVKVRSSCARTVIEANTDFLPNNLPFNFHYKSSESEFTGSTTRSAGMKVGLSKDAGAAKINANLNMDVSVSSDGNGVVSDYSVTAGAEAGVKVGNYSASAGVGASMSDKGGVTDYSISGNAKASVTYSNTTISGGASASLSANKGFDSDFSAGLNQDLKNGLGGSANIKTEVSTKRGCSVSGKVEQTINPAGVQVQKGAVDKVQKESGLKLNTDFTKKDLWSGKFEFKKKD